MEEFILSWWNWLWGNTAKNFIFPDIIASNFTFDKDIFLNSAEVDYDDYEFQIQNKTEVPRELSTTPISITELFVSFEHNKKLAVGTTDISSTKTTSVLSSLFNDLTSHFDTQQPTPSSSTFYDYELGYNSTSDILTNLTYFKHQGTENLYPLIDENNENIFNIIINCTFNNTSPDSILKSNDSTNCTTNDFSQYNYETTLRVLGALATAIILGVIILATVVGNVFVIAAILLERHLQSVANYLILSLAVADLLVACLVMPLSAVYEVSQEWKLGPELCDMWTSCDVLCCTASILHLVAIALDRYWAVTNIDYIHQRTAKRVGFMILIIWGLSFFVSIAPLLGWKDPKWEERVAVDLKCIISQDIGYQIFATASSFYVPLFIILVLYWRIFQTARKRIRRRQQAQTHPEPLANASCLALTAVGFRWKVNAAQSTSSGMVATAAGGSGGIAAAVVTIIGRPLPTISETTTAFTNISSTHTSPEKGSYGNGVERIENDPPTADVSYYGPSNSKYSSRPVITRKKTQMSIDSKRERKAAKTLAIITGAFVCCWLPFFILAILLPSCHCDISPLAMSLSLWLGYFNSTLNPIIYTIFSPEFRHAFKRILCGRRHALRRKERCIRR